MDPFGGSMPPPPPPPSGTPPPPPPPFGGTAPRYQPTAPPTAQPQPPGYEYIPGANAPPPGYQAYTPMGPMSHLPRAGFGARFIGYLMDALLYGFLTVAFFSAGIVSLVASAEACTSEGNQTTCTTGQNGVLVAVGLIVMIGGFFGVVGLYLHALGKSGQTWGRKIAGVKVVDEMTGQPIGFGRALGRQVFAAFFSSQFLHLGYLWMLWDDKQQTWHDKVVGTISITA